MVIGEGSVFASLLILGLVRLERNVRRERQRSAWERNLFLGVTHELKTPLASVQLGLDSLRRLALGESDRKEVIGNMQRGIEDLGCLVDDMLVAARLQRQENLKKVGFEWTEIGEDVLGRLDSIHRQRVHLILEEGEFRLVEGDEALWRLSASNLIENALKYSEGDVVLTLSTKESVATLEVRDEGQGIPVGQRSEALEPFMRLRDEGQGTGLGLHLVSQTAELHGASLEMEGLEPSGFAVRLVWPQGR